MKIDKKPFGILPSGLAADLYTLTNDNGMAVGITNFGGIVTAIRVPDKTGKIEDVVLGYDTLDGYVTDPRYFGCIVGRYANRIRGAKFSLKGKDYPLYKNNGENHLHGGQWGFNKQLWSAELIEVPGEVMLKLAYLSKDGEENYPGNLDVTMSYTLDNNNTLTLYYIAETDKTTIVNLTNHSYFNLAGIGKKDILDHRLRLNADAFTVTAQGLIPTGEIRSVETTPMDFRTFRAIGERINENYDQLTLAGGYDANWVLNNQGSLRLPAAELHEKESGRYMEVLTTEPGLQFYSGNFLTGAIIGKNKIPCKKYSGLCLEAQHFPDSIHHPEFPSTILSPGKQYSQTTMYRFSVKA